MLGLSGEIFSGVNKFCSQVFLVIGAKGSGKSEFLKAITTEPENAKIIRVINENEFLTENVNDYSQCIEKYNAECLLIDMVEFYGDLLPTNIEVKKHIEEFLERFPKINGILVCINANKKKMRMNDKGVLVDQNLNDGFKKYCIVTNDTLELKDCYQFIKHYSIKFPILKKNIIKNANSLDAKELLNLINPNVFKKEVAPEKELNCAFSTNRMPTEVEKLMMYMKTNNLYTKGYVNHLNKNKITIFNPHHFLGLIVLIGYVFLIILIVSKNCIRSFVSVICNNLNMTLCNVITSKDFVFVDNKFAIVALCLLPLFIFIFMVVALTEHFGVALFDKKWHTNISKKKRILSITLTQIEFSSIWLGTQLYGFGVELYEFPKSALPMKKYRIKDTIYWNDKKVFEGYLWGNVIESGTFYKKNGSVLYVLE